MTGVVDQAEKAIDAAEKAQELILGWLGGIQSLVQEYGPQAVELALWTVRVDGIQELASGFLFLIFACLWAPTVMRKTWNNTLEAKRNYEKALEEARGQYVSNKRYESSVFMFVFIGTAPVAVTTYMAVNTLSSVWSWVKVFAPMVYVAKQVTDKVLG